MKKPQKFKPSCPWIKKDMANAKRAGSVWYSLGDGAVGSPACMTSGMIYSPAMKKAKQKADDLVLYAAALGQKQGKLPVDMSGWGGKAYWSGDNGSVSFALLSGAWDPVVIPLKNLEWSPAPAIEDIYEPEADQFLMAA